MNVPVLNGTVTFPEGSSLPATTADWTEAEFAALVFGAVALFTSSLLTGFINLYRDVPYVRIMGVSLLNLLALFCVVLWIGIVTSSRLVPQTGIFLICPLWCLWFYVVGIAAVAVTYIQRLWRLDIILVQQKDADSWRLHFFPMFLFGIGVALCVAGTATHSIGPFRVLDFNGADVVMCYMIDSLMYPVTVYVFSLIFVYIVLALRLMSSRSRIYLEYKQSVISFSIVVMCSVVYAVLVAINLNFLAWGRALNVFMISFLLVAIQWVYLLPLFYKIVFCHERTLAEFNLRK